MIDCLTLENAEYRLIELFKDSNSHAARNRIKVARYFSKYKNSTIKKASRYLNLCEKTIIRHCAWLVERKILVISKKYFNDNNEKLRYEVNTYQFIWDSSKALLKKVIAILKSLLKSYIVKASSNKKHIINKAIAKYKAKENLINIISDARKQKKVLLQKLSTLSSLTRYPNINIRSIKDKNLSIFSSLKFLKEKISSFKFKIHPYWVPDLKTRQLVRTKFQITGELYFTVKESFLNRNKENTKEFSDDNWNRFFYIHCRDWHKGDKKYGKINKKFNNLIGQDSHMETNNIADKLKELLQLMNQHQTHKTEVKQSKCLLLAKRLVTYMGTDVERRNKASKVLELVSKDGKTFDEATKEIFGGILNSAIKGQLLANN